MKKGRFITFEGGDGAGKSSLIISLHAALIEKGHEVIQTRAPGGTAPGKVIRELILHPQEPVVPTAELFLYLADRAQHVEKVILPALNEGKIVLCDRYNDSTIAYQGAARGFGMERVDELCRLASQDLTPDLTLFLDLEPEIGLNRIKCAYDSHDQIEKENLDFHQTLRQAFLDLAQKHSDRIQVVDASAPREEVFQDALKRILDKIEILSI